MGPFIVGLSATRFQPEQDEAARKAWEQVTTLWQLPRTP